MKVTAIFFVVILIFAIGCGGKGEVIGIVDDSEPVSIRDVLTRKHDGETVSIKGKITAVCPSGCWFDIEDDTAFIHVDLAPNGIAIPQEKGSTAIVTGKVKADDARVQFIGSGVMIK